jgi:predicted nucleic acid-binding protein
MPVVVFDACYLMPLLDPQVKGINSNPNVDYLFKTLDKEKAKIIVPTPALSEVLIGAGDAAPRYLEILSRSSRFRIAPFAERAAVEAADAHRRARADGGDKREGSDSSWAKVKFDRQIMAIAKVESADCIYSDDDDIVRLGKKDGIPVVKLHDLPPPPQPENDDQHTMFDALDQAPLGPPAQ